MSVSVRVFDPRYAVGTQASGGVRSLERRRGAGIELGLRPVTLGLAAAAVATLLVLLGVVEQYLTARTSSSAVESVAYRFRLDAEATIPMWFSSMLMLVCALLAAVITLVHRYQGRPDVWRWGMVAAALLGMSIDEAVVLHEMAIGVLRELWQAGGLFYYAWVIVAIPLVVLVAGLGLPMLGRLPRRTAVGLPLSAAIFCLGALSMEMLGGMVFEAAGEVATPTYVMVTTLEEGLEMAGLVVCFYVLLDYLAGAGTRIGAGSGRLTSGSW